jgi:hypothetical protein
MSRHDSQGIDLGERKFAHVCKKNPSIRVLQIKMKNRKSGCARDGMGYKEQFNHEQIFVRRLSGLPPDNALLRAGR